MSSSSSDDDDDEEEGAAEDGQFEDERDHHHRREKEEEEEEEGENQGDGAMFDGEEEDEAIRRLQAQVEQEDNEREQVRTSQLASSHLDANDDESGSDGEGGPRRSSPLLPGRGKRKRSRLLDEIGAKRRKEGDGRHRGGGGGSLAAFAMPTFRRTFMRENAGASDDWAATTTRIETETILSELSACSDAILAADNPSVAYLRLLQLTDLALVDPAAIGQHHTSRLMQGILKMIQACQRYKLVGGQKTSFATTTLTNAARVFMAAPNVLGPAAQLAQWRRAIETGTGDVDGTMDLTAQVIGLAQPSEKLTPYQKVIIFLLDQMYRFRYRRRGTYVYKQMQSALLVAPDGTQHAEKYTATLESSLLPGWQMVALNDTHSWEPESTIEDAVNRLIDRYQNPEQWILLTQGAGTAAHAANYLKICFDHKFKELRTSRLIRSFDNGILEFDTAGNATFHSFARNHPISGDLVCCRHYDQQQLDTRNLFMSHWWYIPTPMFQKILSDQGLQPPIAAVVYAFFGRLLYTLGELDKWQMIMFVKGVGNAGKSSIATVAKGMWDPDDVGVMSSNIEQKFGLDAIEQKRIFICYEVTTGWSLPRSDLQSLISAEAMSIPAKHKTARSVVWRVGGAHQIAAGLLLAAQQGWRFGVVGDSPSLLSNRLGLDRSHTQPGRCFHRAGRRVRLGRQERPDTLRAVDGLHVAVCREPQVSGAKTGRACPGRHDYAACSLRSLDRGSAVHKGRTEGLNGLGR